MDRAEMRGERRAMGPAIALRLRQHLTLTPQVQQALRLLQMSALEFQQEMDQALAANPFLEDKAEPSPRETPAGPAPADPPADAAPSGLEAESSRTEFDAEPSRLDYEVPYARDAAGGGSGEREQDDWSGVSDAEPTLQEHLRGQLMISPMG